MKLLKNKCLPSFFIVGTDTNVGKTVISLLLMKFFFKQGFTPFYLKPLQTGCINALDKESDAKFIYEHIRELRLTNPQDSILYCFKEAKAPLFAARNELSTIPLSDLIYKINKSINDKSPVIIEGAGGLMVPIDSNSLIIDILSHIKVKTIVVGRAGLGTINHCLLSIEALKAKSIKPIGIILSDPEGITSEEMIKENTEAIESFSNVKVLGVIKKIDDFLNISDEYFKIFHNIYPKLYQKRFFLLKTMFYKKFKINPFFYGL